MCVGSLFAEHLELLVNFDWQQYTDVAVMRGMEMVRSHRV